MPLAFASILSSSVTLISTSSNLVVNGLMTQAGLAPMGMFELAPVGIPIALAGLAYMLTLGRRLLPQRETPTDLADVYNVRPYLAEILVLPDSPLAGQTLAQAGLGRDLGLTVLRVVRGKTQYLAPRADTVLEAGRAVGRSPARPGAQRQSLRRH
jgi:di/tricarboxylate transporter